LFAIYVVARRYVRTIAHALALTARVVHDSQGHHDVLLLLPLLLLFPKHISDKVIVT
jgi:hypothetical protein